MAKLDVRRDGAVGRVVFSNPGKYNAMTQDMWEALPAALAGLDEDPAVRLIVMEGDGDQAFVAGADISQFATQRTTEDAQQRYNEVVDLAYGAPGRCSKPVVAKIRGICMGGGLGLAAACDLRFCTDDARFRMPAGRLGLGYDVAGVQRLMAVLGLQNTLDIFFSARTFDAADAQRMGFVSRVAPRADFGALVDGWCEQTAANAPLTLRAAKRTAYALLRDPDQRDMAAVQAAIAACGTSDDYREGARAFMQKRTPVFKGA